MNDFFSRGVLSIKGLIDGRRRSRIGGPSYKYQAVSNDGVMNRDADHLIAPEVVPPRNRFVR